MTRRTKNRDEKKKQQSSREQASQLKNPCLSSSTASLRDEGTRIARKPCVTSFERA